MILSIILGVINLISELVVFYSQVDILII